MKYISGEKQATPKRAVAYAFFIYATLYRINIKYLNELINYDMAKHDIGNSL